MKTQRSRFALIYIAAIVLAVGHAPAYQDAPQDIGDLVYRDSNGQIYGRDDVSVSMAIHHPGHVAVYVGNGEVVEALGRDKWGIPGASGEVMQTPLAAASGVHSYYELWSNSDEYDGVEDHGHMGAKTHNALLNNPNAQTLRQNIKMLALDQVGEGYDNNFSSQKGPGDDDWTCVGLSEAVYEWCAGQTLPSSYPSYGDQSQYAGGLNITPDGYQFHFNDLNSYCEENVEFSQIPVTSIPLLIGRWFGLEKYVFFPYTQFQQRTLIDAFPAPTAAAPTITSVSPATLPTSSSAQLITINGTSFKPLGDPNASSLVFYDPANNTYARTPVNVTTSSMQYNLNVQSAAGTWKVKVVNGGVESLPFSFTVTASGSQLTGLSILGPATVAENSSGQFSSTAYFSDGSSSTVSSGTTWTENSSATTITSSGLLSAGSVSGDTAVTVSATYTVNGVTKTTSANAMVVNSGSGGGPTTIHPLVNGTFENGLSPWAPSGYADVVALSYPHLGSWYAYLCNANDAVGSIAQFFPIPAGTTAATLQFYLNIVSQETAVYTAYDTMKVDLITANEQYVGTIAQFSNLDKGANVNGSYVLKSYNIMPLMSAYRGQSLFLIFSGQTDGTSNTIFRIDDIDITLTVDNPVSLTGLGIRGPSSIPETQGGQFWADAIFSDGTTQQISPNSWSDNSSVTAISSDGFLSSTAVGADIAVTVTASYTFDGVTRQATKPVTIVDTNATHTLSSLAISGPSSMKESSFGQFTATAIFADGTAQTVTPTWSETSTATTISSGGLLNAGDVGADTSVTVAASYTTGGITRSASQDVLIVNLAPPSTLSSLAINGPTVVDENSVAQYTATASFSDGSLQIVSPTWSENSTAATISAFGLLNAGEVTSHTPVTVSANYTFGGLTRNAQATVTILNAVATQSFTLTVNAANGTVTKNPDQASYNSRSQVTLTAIPAGGFLFSGWSGDAAGTQNPLTLLMMTNKNITASFIPVVSPNQPYEAKWAQALNTFSGSASAPAQNGGMVLFGTFTGTITAGGQSLTANGTPKDFYGVKFNASHQVVWVRQYGGPNEEVVASCAQHPAGGWAIAGTFKDAGTIGGLPLISAGGRDAYLARLDEDGNVLWAKRGGGTSVDHGSFAGVDGAGNCFLFGKFTSSATFTDGNVTLNAVGTGFDILAAKYTGTGGFLWAKSGGGPAYDDLFCAKVDTAGNAYFGGIFEIQTTFGPYTVINAGSSTDWDGFLVKLNSTGDVLWLKKFGQSSGDSSGDYVKFVAPAGDGTCFLGGQYERAMLVDGQALPDQSSTFTAFVGKIGSGGTVEWLRGLPVTALPELGAYSSLSRAERGLPLADGGVIFGGSYQGRLAFGSTTSTNASAEEFLYFARFDAGGTAQWAMSSDSPGFGYVHYFGSASGERVRFGAKVSQPVGLPGISTISVASGDTVLVELGPPEIVMPPFINVNLVGDKLVLTWPATASGFALEWATNLPPTGWTSNSVVPVAVGGNLTVTNPVSGGMKFFRLKK